MATTRRHRSRRTRVLLGLAVLIVIGVAAFFTYRALTGTATVQTTYTTAAVQKMTLTQSVSGTGNVSLSSTASVTPQVSGTVSGLSVAVGDTVQEGEILFTLVNPQLDIDVANAQSAYDKAELGVSQAKLSVQQAQLNYSQVLEQYEDQSETTTTANSQTNTTRPSSSSTMVSPAPTVTGISPNAGPTAGGTSVTITGTNLTGATAVNFGDTVVTDVTVVDATHLTVTSPPHDEAVTMNVTVTTSRGTSATSSADHFTYVEPPTVTGIDPGSGSTGGGTTVTITGTELTGTLAVNFGDIAATNFTVDSTTEITALSPPQAAAGPVDVTVATPGGISATSPADQFTYTGASSTTTAPASSTTTANSDANGGSIGPVVFLAAQNSLVAQTSNTISSLDVKAAAQQITNAQLSEDSAEIQLESADVALQNAKETAAERGVVAPMSGTITALNIANGDTVGGGTGSSSSSTGAVITITNLDLFQATVALAETDVTSVEVGQKAVLAFDALPDLTLTGKVTSVDTTGTNNQGVVSYNVVITPDVSDPSVKGGMTVEVNIITQVATDVLAVPNAAVKTSSSGDQYVQILQNGQPTDVTVQTGLTTDSYTEITSGLSEGQDVITATVTPTAGGTTTTFRRTGGGINGGGGQIFNGGGGPPGGF